MAIDPYLGPTALALAVIFIVGLILNLVKQPHVIAYILAGVVLGGSVLGIIPDQGPIERLGGLGVTFLLFFVGMEINPSRLIGGWRISVLGTLVQVGLSVAISFGVGTLFGWSAERSLLLGFVISLSSTAVVLKLLEDWKQIDSPLGQDTIGVLIVQDIAAIAMIIVLGMLVTGPEALSASGLMMQLVGGIALATLLLWVALGKTVHLPFAKQISNAPELQVFGALALCFGLGWVGSVLGLSTALGAFAGGVIVGAAKETRWVSSALEPFRTVFLGLFFVSVGLLLDLNFIAERAAPIALLVLAVLLSSMAINTLIYKFGGYDWRQSVYAGALLSQPGEFSFVLTALGASTGLITGVGYQLSLSVIALSLAISPIHIQLVKWVLKPDIKNAAPSLTLESP